VERQSSLNGPEHLGEGLTTVTVVSTGPHRRQVVAATCAEQSGQRSSASATVGCQCQAGTPTGCRGSHRLIGWRAVVRLGLREPPSWIRFRGSPHTGRGTAREVLTRAYCQIIVKEVLLRLPALLPWRPGVFREALLNRHIDPQSFQIAAIGNDNKVAYGPDGSIKHLKTDRKSNRLLGPRSTVGSDVAVSKMERSGRGGAGKVWRGSVVEGDDPRGRRDGVVGGGVRRVSVVEAGRQGLIEVEVGLGLSVRGVEGGSLIEQEVALGRVAGWGEGRGPVWEIEMEEDGGDDGRVSEEGEDGHGAAAHGAEERQDLVDACEQHGPSNPRGAWAPHRLGIGKGREGLGRGGVHRWG